MARIPDGVARTCVTSPPYWGLRDYGIEGQLGLENTPEEYVQKITAIFREVRRILKDDGTLWLNIGDSYYGSGNAAGHTEKSMNFGRSTQSYGASRQGKWSAHPILKPKDLIGIPWKVAFALQSDGWWLRSDIIWSKPNPMPESITDRPTRAHEYIFLLTKSRRYYYNSESIREPAKDWGVRDRSNWKARDERHSTGPAHRGGENGNFADRGRNKRTVWTITAKPYREAHFATYPPDLIEPCILAGSAPGDVVLDPFMGSGTTAMVALKHRRHFTGYELNPEYHELISQRVDPYLNQARLPVDDPPPLISGGGQV